MSHREEIKEPQWPKSIETNYQSMCWLINMLISSIKTVQSYCDHTRNDANHCIYTVSRQITEVVSITLFYKLSYNCLGIFLCARLFLHLLTCTYTSVFQWLLNLAHLSAYSFSSYTYWSLIKKGREKEKMCHVNVLPSRFSL